MGARTSLRAAAIRWLKPASGFAIAEYINRDSPFYAQRVAEEILELAASIAERPQIGRIVPELKDESAVALAFAADRTARGHRIG